MVERPKDKPGGAAGNGLSGQSSPRRPDSSPRTTPAPSGRDQPIAADAGDEAGEAGSAPAPKEREEEQVERDLGDLLADVERQRDEYLELAQRTKADFENYRRRVAGEAREAEKRGRGELARDLIPVLDNLDRALAAASADDASGSLADGVRLVRSELVGALERSGIESYEPSGEEFDPHLHEAMMMRAAPRDEAGKVLEVIEKGYRLDGQVLRPARVVVGSQDPDGSEQQPSEQQPSRRKPPDGSQSG